VCFLIENSDKELDVLESYWLKTIDKKYLYNTQFSAISKNPRTKFYKHSMETIQKIRLGNLGKKRTFEQKSHLYLRKGRKWNKEHCLKLSLAHEKKIDWPTNDDLIEMLRDSSFSKVARELNVRPNTLRKHVRVYGIEDKALEVLGAHAKARLLK
jgi:hypothetical protein